MGEQSLRRAPGALLLLTGKLADTFGRKRLFMIGLVVFAAGSLLAAVSDGATALIGARAVQAIGAAAIMPSTLSTVNATFRGKYRAAAFGVWGAVISGAAAIGPLAGAALTEWVSWHWIFLINLPLVAIVLVAAFVAVPETRSGKPRPGAARCSARSVAFSILNIFLGQHHRCNGGSG